MTARERKMVAVGLAVSAALAGVVYWLWLILRNGDESGIRVKNGSLFLETKTANGWQAAGSEFESKGQGRTCFTVTVTNVAGTCTMSTLTGVSAITFEHIGGGSGGPHRLGMQGRRFRARLADSWRINTGDRRRLEADNPQFRLRMVEARRGSDVLRCTFGGRDDDMIDLDASDAC